jgi:hypothetical protein
MERWFQHKQHGYGRVQKLADGAGPALALIKFEGQPEAIWVYLDETTVVPVTAIPGLMRLGRIPRPPVVRSKWADDFTVPVQWRSHRGQIVPAPLTGRRPTVITHRDDWNGGNGNYSTRQHARSERERYQNGDGKGYVRPQGRAYLHPSDVSDNALWAAEPQSTGSMSAEERSKKLALLRTSRNVEDRDLYTVFNAYMARRKKQGGTGLVSWDDVWQDIKAANPKDLHWASRETVREIGRKIISIIGPGTFQRQPTASRDAKGQFVVEGFNSVDELKNDAKRELTFWPWLRLQIKKGVHFDLSYGKQRRK